MNPSGRFLRFAGVGAIATAIHYAVLMLLVEAGNVPAVGASSLGFACGAAFSYLANHRWTFARRADHSSAALRYVGMLGVGFALNAAVVWLLHDVLGLWYVPAQVVSTALGLFVNYLIASRWVYVQRPGRGAR